MPGPRSRARKVVLGVLVVVILVLAVGLPVLFTYVRRPGPLLEGERLLGANTTVHAELTLRREDPGARHLARRLLEGRSRGEAAALRFAFFKLTSRNLRSLNGGPLSDADVDRLLPVKLVLSREAGEPAPVLAVSYPVAAHSLQLFGSVVLLGALPVKAAERRSHQGQSYFGIDTDPPYWLALPEETLLLTRTEDALKARLDHLAAPSLGELDSVLHALLEAMPAEAALRVVARNAGALASLLRGPLPGVVAGMGTRMRHPEPVALWLAIDADGTLTGEFRTQCASIASDPTPSDEWMLTDRGVRVHLLPLPDPYPCAHAWTVQIEGVPQLVEQALQ
jgi:hypothetical protein